MQYQVWDFLYVQMGGKLKAKPTVRFKDKINWITIIHP